MKLRNASLMSVNERLVVSASRIINLLTKPVQNLNVQPNRDAGLSRRHLQYRTPSAFAEIIFLLHIDAPHRESALLRPSSRTDIALASSSAVTAGETNTVFPHIRSRFRGIPFGRHIV
jgi:hypothetical protein